MRHNEIVKACRLFLEKRNDKIINANKIGTLVVLDGLTIDGKLYSYTAIVKENDRSSMLKSIKNQKNIKMKNYGSLLDDVLEEDVETDDEGISG